MKKLLFVIVAAALAWSGYWFFQASALKGAIEDWQNLKTGSKREVSFSDVAIAGFPNRLDTTFTDFEYRNLDTGGTWTLPQLQVLRMVYSDRNTIIAFPNTQTLAYRNSYWTITSERLLASYRRGRENALTRFIAEAPYLKAESSDGASITLTSANFAIEQTDVEPGLYRSALSADISNETNTSAVGTLTAQSELRFATPLVLGKRHPVVQQVNLQSLEYTLGEMRIDLDGDFDVDRKGRLTGDLEFEVENWRALLDQSGDDLRFLNDILTIVASLQGNGAKLNGKLRVNKGTISLGPLPIGQIPPIPQP